MADRREVTRFIAWLKTLDYCIAYPDREQGGVLRPVLHDGPCLAQMNEQDLLDMYMRDMVKPADDMTVMCCYSSSHFGKMGCAEPAKVTAFLKRFDGELHPSRRCMSHALLDDEPGWPLALVLETVDLLAALGYTFGYRKEPPGAVLWRRS